MTNWQSTLSNLWHDSREWGMIQQPPLGQKGKKRKCKTKKPLINQGKEWEWRIAMGCRITTIKLSKVMSIYYRLICYLWTPLLQNQKPHYQYADIRYCSKCRMQIHLKLPLILANETTSKITSAPQKVRQFGRHDGKNAYMPKQLLTLNILRW